MEANSSKKKVLIIEDRKPIIKALNIKLERSGFEVKMAEDGEAGLKALESDKFDLILLDIVLPKINGFTILAEMQARKIDTPVIVLSNLSQEEDARRAKELGAKDYFIKSDISINEVVKRVSRVLATENSN